MADGRQPHRGDAAALMTIRRSPKLAGCYLRGEVGGDGLRGSGKDTFGRILGGRRDLLDQGVRHVQYRIFKTQSFKLRNSRSSLRRRKYLRVGGTDLWCEEAEPDLCNLRAAAPEIEELIEVA